MQVNASRNAGLNSGQNTGFRFNRIVTIKKAESKAGQFTT
jgi:hypothetical protein